MQHTNPEIVIAIIAASVLFLLLAGFIVLFLIFYNKKKSFHLKEMQEQQRLFEQAALVSKLEIKEQTLLSVAQEIHDNVGQGMLLVKLNLNKTLISDDNAALMEIRELVSEAINDLRDFSKSYNSQQIIANDFTAAIQREVDRIKKTGVVQIELVFSGEDKLADPSKKLILIRMLQEIFQNIIKHSKCTQVKINIKYLAEILILDIEDNGIGFHKAINGQATAEMGAGLLNLEQRAKLLNATLTYNSEPNEGTCISIKMPY